MSALDPQAVVDASNAWIWVPEGMRTVESPDYLLVHYPSYFDDPVQVLRTGSDRPAAELVVEVRAHVRDWEAESLVWWIKLDTTPADLEAELLAGGGRLDETVTVLARDLGEGLPDAGLEGVEVRTVEDLDTVRDRHQVDQDAFGFGPLTDEQMDEVLAQVRRSKPGQVSREMVGYLDSAPVGSGGVTVVDGVARLWGGATVEAARGRGVYRAVLHSRLTWAVDQGARLALVKGRVDTSGPILRRLGFEAYGEERSYRLSV